MSEAPSVEGVHPTTGGRRHTFTFMKSYRCNGGGSDLGGSWSGLAINTETPELNQTSDSLMLHTEAKQGRPLSVCSQRGLG